MFHDVVEEVGAGVRREEGRAVVVRVNLPDHVHRVHDLFPGLRGHAQHVVGPDHQPLLAADLGGPVVVLHLGPLAQKVEHPLVAALEADEVAPEPGVGHGGHHLRMADDDVRPALAEERLPEPLRLVPAAELRHPDAVLGQAVVVEHERGEAIPVPQFLQLANDRLGAGAAHPLAEDHVLARLAEGAVVNAAPPGDDGQKRRRQFLDEGHLRRIEGIAELAPFVEEKVAVGEGDSVQVRLLAPEHFLLRRIPLGDGLQQPGESDLPLAGDQVVHVRQPQTILHRQRDVRPADDSGRLRPDLVDDLQGLPDGVVIHTHHRQTRHVGSPLPELLPEMIPALQRPQVNEIHVQALRFGRRAEIGQPVADPASIHPLAEAIEPPAGNARVDQRRLHAEFLSK